MVRSALSTRGAPMSRGPRPGYRAVPMISVVVASLLSALPIISATGWWPDFGLLMLLGWRMLRADAWPVWAAAPLGLAHDLLTAGPLGLAMATWTAFMIAMDLIDRRTQWRDYWIEWVVAACFLTLAELAQWNVARLAGAPVRFAAAWPSIPIAILSFPLAAALATRLDRWRLGQ